MDRTTEEYLRIIERTRLLYNTLAETGKVVGSSVESGNGLIRKGGKSEFMKNAVLHELGYRAKTNTGLDLEEVLDAYIDCDQLLQRHERVLQEEDACQQLIRYFYADGKVKETLRPVVKEMGSEHVPILVLMLLKALPTLSAKGGDIKDIAGDYQRAFSMLYATCQTVLLKIIPVLIKKEGEVRQNPSLMCRFHLISVVNEILNVYGGISTPENLSRTNAEESEKQIFPNNVSGIWVENEKSTVFWQFERNANGDWLRRYTLNNEQRSLTYTQYHIRFYEEGDEVLAVVFHPQLVCDIVQNVPIPLEHVAYLEYRMEDGTMFFEPKITESNWFHLKQLTRSQEEKFFQRCLDNRRYTKTNLYAEYEYTFHLWLHTITEDALFFETEEEGCLLRVPKSLHPQLHNVHFGENAGLLQFKDSQYLAFDDRHLYFEITTEKQRKQLGITKCKKHIM